MCEMLGNQYFLARNFADAEIEFEKSLKENPKNKAVRKKLIICRIQTGKYEKAIDEFISLLEDDFDYLTDTDLVEDDCPCSDAIFKIEKFYSLKISEPTIYTVIGMLWTYCDLNRAYEYFDKSFMLGKNPKTGKILSLLNEKTGNVKKENSSAEKIELSNQGGNL